MAKTAEILVDRIDQKLAELGKSRWWLSMEISDRKQPGIVKDMDRRGTVPSAERLRAIAEKLGTTSDWLLGRTDNPAQPVSEVSFAEAPAPFRRDGQGIPLLGTAYCDDLAVEGADGGPLEVERVQLELDHTVRLIERPPALWNARDAYAIYFHGSSMEPRFYQGEVGVVDPRRPPGPGDFVVVQLNDGSSDSVVTVLVKQLVRAGGGYVELRQFNPETTFRVPRDQVAHLHRIFTPNELLGG